MSYHVPLEAIELNNEYYNLAFIILKTHKATSWTQYFHHIDWNNDIPIPKSFYILDLGPSGKHTYHPCAPFYLSEDECSSWLQWAEVQPTTDDDPIKMLQFKQNPSTVLNDPTTKTGIASFIQHALWAEQQSSNSVSFGNFSRMEELVRQTINSQLRNVANTVVNRLRPELQERRQDRRRSRSRSPEKRNRRSKSPVQQLQLGQQPLPNQYVMPQQFCMPQQQPQNQQLSQPQLQWNTAVTNMSGNQPQPGLLYQPQRMN